MILDSILNTIGCTPLVKLNKLAPEGSAQILLKIFQSGRVGKGQDCI